MRIWSIHPKYLDPKRFVAQWREALLCRAVLNGETKGYKNHPQFLRVKEHFQPHYFINSYLYEIWEESKKRNYNFDRTKLMDNLYEKFGEPLSPMEVTEGQLEYEFNHLQSKLGEFDEKYIENEQLIAEEGILSHPNLVVIPGDVMKFEKIKI